MKQLKGQFLVASPHLGDPNFYRAVVLMVQHDEHGALGLILNRPTDRTIADMWELIDDERDCDADELVHVGGPVTGPLLAVHTDSSCAENTIVDGVYFASSRPALTRVILEFEGPRRLFVGYSGWGAKQLENELEVGGWLTYPATREAIFSDYDSLWTRVASQVGLDILAPAIKKNIIPDDPTVN